MTINHYDVHYFNPDKILPGKTLLLLVMLLTLFGFTSPLFANNTWSLTGDLNTPRSEHTSTQINSNQVLITGGVAQKVNLGSAEILNLNTSVWTYTTSMLQKRRNHSAILLNSGRVLVAGGLNRTQNNNGSYTTTYFSSVEIFNPATATWSMAASMLNPRAGGFITKLQDGRLLVTGGRASNGVLYTAELYNPANNTWSSTGAMVSGSANAARPVLLKDGRVFLPGHAGATEIYTSAERPQIYNPASNSWTAASPMNTPRFDYAMTVLNDGTVLAAGGDIITGSWSGWYPIYSCNIAAEIYDPNTDSWSNTGFMNRGRSFLQATLLPDGKVIAFGSANLCQVSNKSAEIYDPGTGTWSATDSLFMDHSSSGKTNLADGKILLSGGLRWSTSVDFNITEVYTPTGPSPISPPRSQYLHIADIDSISVPSATSSSWTAFVTVTVVDENTKPAYDVRVDISGKFCLTDNNGQCTVKGSTIRDTQRFNVTNISMLSAYSDLPQITYQPAANTDPDGNSDGTGIIVFRSGGSTAPPPAVTAVHIADLDDVSSVNGSLWSPAVTVTVRDNLGNLKRSAFVTGLWGNGLTGYFQCTTTASGSCTDTYPTSIDISTAPTGDVTITKLSYSTVAYDSSANTDPDGDSNGTRIVLQAP